ncbi:MAG: autotransporter domain-containing protein, partial [Henriciella sp.]|uniref:autotransporter outer membrane beta-barrel domain-containing protein n=1 Tax=Henriciella sp. TaxID=1968823 RepID=UPI003C76910D
ITVSTTGARASGIVLGSSGDLAMVDSSTTLTFDNLDITTAGDNARGLQVQGLSAALNGNMTNSDWAMLLQNSAISTSGNDANGAEIFGLGGTLTGSTITLVSTGVDVTTTGDRSNGFVVGSLPEIATGDETRTSLALAFGTIATSGENADAIRIGTGWGSPGADPNRPSDENSRLATLEISEDVSATGTGSDGLVTSSLINTLTVSDTGSLSADRFAILSQGVGGIETLTNAGTITGDIQLGDEDSTLTNSGTLTGNVDLGGGSNVLTIDAGSLFNTRDQVLLGAGNVLTISGDVSPGDGGPVQVTSVEGDIVFETGSRFLVDIDGSADDASLAGIGASDRLEIDGTATLNGGTVAVSSLTPRTGFSSFAEYQILSATDGVTGTFADLDSNLPFLTLSLQHNADNVLLIAERGFFAPDFVTAAVTPNQLAVASAFDAIETGATGDMAAVLDQLIFTNSGQALTAFDTTSGEIYASMLAQAGANGTVLSRQALSRSRRSFAPGWGIWAAATGSDGSIDPDGNGGEIEHGNYGFDVGADFAAPDNRWVAGVALGYRSGDVTLDPRQSDVDYEDKHISAYGRYGTGGRGLTASAAATLADIDADVARRIVVGNFVRRAFADASIESQSLAAEDRYGLAAGEKLSIGPVVSVAHTSTDLGGFRERGADSLNLVSSGSSDEQTSVGAGVFANWQSERSSLDLSVQYVNGASNSTSSVAAFEGAPDARFNIRAPGQDTSGVQASATGSVSLGENWTASLLVDGLAGETMSSLNGSIVLGRRF